MKSKTKTKKGEILVIPVVFAKTSEILYKIPEDSINVSLVSNDADTPGGVSNLPGCTDWLAAVEQLRLEMREQLELEEMWLEKLELEEMELLEKLEIEEMEWLQKMEQWEMQCEDIDDSCNRLPIYPPSVPKFPPKWPFKPWKLFWDILHV